MESHSEQADLNARRVTYSFLSNMFLKEVTEDFLSELGQNSSISQGDLGKFIQGLATADLSEVRRSAVADFSSMLLNMSVDPVYPYESVYTSSERLLMQEARHKVLGIYLKEGFACSDAVQIPEDHVGIELEFMARMCQKELDALTQDDIAKAQEARKIQKMFVEEHLKG